MRLLRRHLDSQQAREALQRHTDEEALWEVFASPADRIGDNVAVSGAAARFRPIVVGASFQDRGMGNDSHDAVAVVITLRLPILSRQRGVGATWSFSAWASVAGARFAYAVGGSSEWSF